MAWLSHGVKPKSEEDVDSCNVENEVKMRERVFPKAAQQRGTSSIFGAMTIYEGNAGRKGGGLSFIDKTHLLVGARLAFELVIHRS